MQVPPALSPTWSRLLAEGACDSWPLCGRSEPAGQPSSKHCLRDLAQHSPNSPRWAIGTILLVTSYRTTSTLPCTSHLHTCPAVFPGVTPPPKNHSCSWGSPTERAWELSIPTPARWSPVGGAASLPQLPLTARSPSIPQVLGENLPVIFFPDH